MQHCYPNRFESCCKNNQLICPGRTLFFPGETTAVLGVIMWRKNHIIIAMMLWCCLHAAAVYAEPAVLRVPKAQSDFSVPQDYFVQLLRKALVKGANGREVPQLVETSVLEQGRATHELVKGGLIDVYWMGTDKFREQNLRAIRIPLDRGLLGFRRFIIHRDMRAKFDQVSNLTELKQFVACQGLDWPDTRILTSAGLSVREISGFEHLFQQVVAKRCDYFPRGYFEVLPELEHRKDIYPDLIEYKSLILHYPFTVYFFVNRKNETLAQWLELGLERMIDDGELMVYMQQHPLTAHIFPLAQTKNTRRINIPNPLLTEDTNYKNSRYWFQPEDFFTPKH
jgi:hypothetical protein